MVFRAAIMLLLGAGGCVDFSEEERRQPDVFLPGRRAGPGNLAVTLETWECESEDRLLAETALRHRDPAVIVEGGAALSSNGLLVSAAARGFETAFRAEGERSRSRRRWSQLLVTADGQPARLQVTESSWVHATMAVPVYHGAAALRTVHERVTGAGFEVRPRKLHGRMLEVELMPWIASEAGENVHRLAEVKAKVVVESGRPIMIFSEEEARDSFGASFLGWRGSAGRRHRILVLRVEGDP
jgi:hypothetical protein